MKRFIILLAMCIASTGIVFSQEELDDQDIADAIENQYRFDHAIDINKINVSVVDGIVELTGIVANLGAKERATKIAELVKGVRAVSNRIDVNPPVILSDEGIRKNVEKALMLDPATDSYEVDVSVDDKQVVLTGIVDSYQEKELCANVAKSVTGVKEMVNNIFVDYDSDRSDIEIENEIRESLKWSALVEDGLIDVKVNNGNVKLSGVVGSASEKSNVYRISWVAGVKSIDHSGLEVRWWANDSDLRKNKHVPKTDKEIADAINDALMYDPRAFSFEIIPEVENGYVTLRGSVDNLKAKMAAEKIAEHTTGVTGVINRIRVNSMEIPISDNEIEADILTALNNDAVIEPWEINVNVRNGTVTLFGIVDSYLEKKKAEWIASGISGVTDVNNMITVNYPHSYYWWGHYPYHDLYLTPPKTEEIPYGISDEQIKKNVESELWWSPFVDRDEVTVIVENGNVTLKGVVDSWREYHAAAENAWEGGAWSVDNDLIVE